MNGIIEPAGSISSEAVERAMPKTGPSGLPSIEELQKLASQVGMRFVPYEFLDGYREEHMALAQVDAAEIDRLTTANQTAMSEIAKLLLENQKMREEVAHLKSERLYIVGFNDGWEEAIEQAAQVVEGLQVPKSPNDGELKPRRYPSQTSVLIAAAIRSLKEKTDGGGT